MLRPLTPCALLLLATAARGQALLAEWPSPDAGGDPVISIGTVLAAEGAWFAVPYSDRALVYSTATGERVYDFAAPTTGDGAFSTVALQGDELYWGLPNAAEPGEHKGVVRIFDLLEGREVSELHPSDAPSFDDFGGAVAVCGDRILVGASRADAPGAELGDDSGAAYVFDRTTGQELQKLVPTVAGAGGRFGFAVALSSDYIVIAAPYSAVNGFNAGLCEVYDATTFQYLGALAPPQPLANETLGWSLALDGIHAVTGNLVFATGGTVRVFDLTTLSETLAIPNPGPPQSAFGYRVALHGNTLLASGSAGTFVLDATTGQVIASYGPPLGTYGGVAIDGALIAYTLPSIYSGGSQPGVVYLRDAATLNLLQTVHGGDSDTSDDFGSALTVDGGRVFVGAQDDDDLGSSTGSVYAFEASTGALLLTLNEEDASGTTSLNGPGGGRFGASVAASAGKLVVGTPLDNEADSLAGSAWIVDATTGAALFELFASNGSAGDRFGTSVAIDGALAVVGAPLFGAGDKGLAYVFDTATGAQVAILGATDAVAHDEFGTSVAISANVALVGAPLQGAVGQNAGAVYVFDATTGAQLAKLTGSDTDAFDSFGHSVALDGELALIGAPAAGLQTAGAAYVFDVSSRQELARLAPSDGVSNDTFGQHVALRAGPFGGKAVVGSGSAGGSAYVFDVSTAAELSKLVPGVSFGGNPAVALDGQRVFVGPAQVLAPSVFVFDEPAVPPVVYCTAKASSAGCLASISTSNPLVQPVSGAGNYALRMTDAQGFKNGLFFVGIDGPAAIPFLGGTLCIQPPLGRGPVLFTGGTSPTSCDGRFTQIVNDGVAIPAGFDAGAGNSAWYQAWYRDPQNGAGQLGTALSNAVRLDFE